MLRNEFNASMEKILAFYATPKNPADAAQMASYMAALFESLKWVNGFDFEETTRRILPRLNGMKRPMPGEFISSLEVFVKDRAQSQGDRPERESSEQTTARARSMANTIGSRGACYSYLLAEKYGHKPDVGIQAVLIEKMAQLSESEIVLIQNQIDKGDPYAQALENTSRSGTPHGQNSHGHGSLHHPQPGDGSRHRDSSGGEVDPPDQGQEIPGDAGEAI